MQIVIVFYCENKREKVTSLSQVVSKNISRVALISEEATKYLAQKYLLTRDQITFGLPTSDVR